MSDIEHRYRRQGPRRVPGLLAGILLMGGVLVGCAQTGAIPSSPGATLGSEMGVSFGPDAGRADWWVAPTDTPLSPDAQVINGFLEERACASGSSPEGRILGPVIEYQLDALVVTYKVRKIGGTCQSNPRFPITIELAEALGTRGLYDGGVEPRRDATVDPTVVIAPHEYCGPLQGTSDAKIACIAFVNATLGDRYVEFAEVRVSPAEADCAADSCTDASAIEARTWIVEASDLGGTDLRWTCTYRDEVATCSPS